MAPEGEEADREAAELEALREVIPGRAVLTELARGFLLVQSSNPQRAVQFAATFLRECTGASAPERIEGTRPVTVAQLRFGRSGHGPVEPKNGPP